MSGSLALALAWLLHLAAPPPALTETADLIAETEMHRATMYLVAAVCVRESRGGLDERAASVCGVRLRGRYVGDARLSVEIATRSLSRWQRRCRGSVTRALVAYRYGRGCRARDREGYARSVLRIERRLRRLVPRAAAAIATSSAWDQNSNHSL